MTPEQQQQRIMGYFIEEAKDHLQTIEHGVLNLQEILADPESINELFRAAHSIKGGSAMLGVGSIQHIAHRLEDYFKILKEDSSIDVDERLKSLLLAGFDRLQDLLEHLESNFRISDELSASTISELEPVFNQLEAHLNKLAAKQPVEVSTKQETVAEPATNGLFVLFQDNVTAKLRDMLQLFKQNDEPATRQKLQSICGELYQLGDRFQLVSWCALITKARQAIASTQNTYRTLAPVLIKDINQAKELVLANRELEILESPQLQALIPFIPPISIEEDDEISTIFTTGSLGEPASIDLDAISESEDFVAIDRADAEVEAYDEAELAVNNLDWLNEDVGQDRHVDGPKVGASEMKSLATLFENEDIDIESAWEDIETNETQISIHGDSQTQREQDELTDLLNSSTDENQAISGLDSTANDLAGLFGSEFASANQVSPQLDDSDTLFPSDMNLGNTDNSGNLIEPLSESELFPNDPELFPNDIDGEDINEASLMPGLEDLEEITSEESILESELFPNDFLEEVPSAPDNNLGDNLGDNLDETNLFEVSGNLDLSSGFIDDNLFLEPETHSLEDDRGIETSLSEVVDSNQLPLTENHDWSSENDLQLEEIDPFALDNDSVFDILSESSNPVDLAETTNSVEARESNDPFAVVDELEEIDSFLDIETESIEETKFVDKVEPIQADEPALFEALGFDEDDSLELTSLDRLPEDAFASEELESEEVSSETHDVGVFDEVKVDDLESLLPSEIDGVTNTFEIGDLDDAIASEESNASVEQGHLESQIAEDLGLTDFLVEDENSEAYGFTESDDLESPDLQPESEFVIESDRQEEIDDFFAVNPEGSGQSPLELGDRFWASDVQAETIETESLETDFSFGEDLGAIALDTLTETLGSTDTEAVEFPEILDSHSDLSTTEDSLGLDSLIDREFIDDPIDSLVGETPEVSSDSADSVEGAFSDLADGLDLDALDELSDSKDPSVATEANLDDPSSLGEALSNFTEDLDLDSFQEAEVDETFDFMGDRALSANQSTAFDNDSSVDDLSGFESIFEEADTFDGDDIPVSTAERFNLEEFVGETLEVREESDAFTSSLTQESTHEGTDDFGLGDFFDRAVEQSLDVEIDLGDEVRSIADTSDREIDAITIEESEFSLGGDLSEPQIEQESRQSFDWDDDAQILDDDSAQASEDNNDNTFAMLISTSSGGEEETAMKDFFSMPDARESTDDLGQEFGEFAIADAENQDLVDFFGATALDAESSELDFEEKTEAQAEPQLVDAPLPSQDILDEEGGLTLEFDELIDTSGVVDTFIDESVNLDDSLSGFDSLLEEQSGDTVIPQTLDLEMSQNPNETPNLNMSDEDLSFLDFADISESENQAFAINQPTEESSATIDSLVDFFEIDDESDLPQQEKTDWTSEQDGNADDLQTFDSFDLSDNFLEELEESSTATSSMSDTDRQVNEMDASASEEGDMFEDLEAMLGESVELNTPSSPVTSQTNGSSSDGFDELEALLGSPPASVPAPTNALPVQSSDDFGDLEKMLQDTYGKDVGPLDMRPKRQEQRPRKPKLTETTMRVDVRHLDSLNNLVGELVVNRNLLEQDQERLQQFINNLLHQVQQLSEVSQRMRDQYDRSLLENSLMAGRSRSHSFDDISRDLGDDSDGTASEGFEGIEFDRYNTFHILSQEIIELIVRVRESASDIQFVVTETEQVTRQLGTITTQIQDDLKQSRMVPFAQIADRLPRGVRERSIKSGKQAELEVYGRETLIDKAILEQLSDPLTHLVNNAIDHGLEDPGTRQAGSKAAMGKITVRAYHQGNQTVISIGDDGAGINPEGVKQSAVKKGVRTQSEVANLTDNEVYDLLFEAGFSTAAQADEFKGRGVGLDVVKSSLDDIRGSMYIESAIGKGTTFTIRLPLTLSISKAMFCISDRARIAFPVDGFEDMIEVPQSQIQLNSKGQPCLPWRDTILPFQHLSNLLAYNRHISRSNIYGKQDNDEVCIIILRNEGNYLALQVDQFLGEYEIVIKQLEGPIPKPVGIAGATVLGDGRVMAIANVLELFDIASGRLRPSVSSTPVLPPDDKEFVADPTVLIVDDSITVRELLSLTFAKVGYRVEQARDGQDAWDKLRAGLPCDLIFCDIEMPRMDGLDLLSRLQKEPELSKIPVAMLTSRGADRHRQTAIQLGAKGYFTKPYLEEELLSASQRMLKGEVLVSL
ncbi:hypothetical protein TUMEXPCC7403_18505 [Tumidithrix helvetica PCC 7403]|uniref:hybrid sensor histidine kinase/response regulator n=1 Tax=Tumidithrix helvetica TaxID=3457545 RepID=UPI003C804F7A